MSSILDALRRAQRGAAQTRQGETPGQEQAQRSASPVEPPAPKPPQTSAVEPTAAQQKNQPLSPAESTPPAPTPEAGVRAATENHGATAGDSVVRRSTASFDSDEVLADAARRRELDDTTRELARMLAGQRDEPGAGAAPESPPPSAAVVDAPDRSSSDSGAGGGAGPGRPAGRKSGLLKIAAVVALGLGIGVAASRLFVPADSENGVVEEPVVATQTDGGDHGPEGAASASTTAGSREPTLKPSDEGNKRKPAVLAPGSPKRSPAKREAGTGKDERAGKPARKSEAAEATAAGAGTKLAEGDAPPRRDPFASAAKPEELDLVAAQATGEQAGKTSEGAEGNGVDTPSASEAVGVVAAASDAAPGDRASDGAADTGTQAPAGTPGDGAAQAGEAGAKPAMKATTGGEVGDAGKPQQGIVATAAQKPAVTPRAKPFSQGKPADAAAGVPKGAVPAPMALGARPPKPAPPVDVAVAADPREPGAEDQPPAAEEGAEEAALDMAASTPPATEVLDRPPPGAPEVVLLFIQWSNFPDRRVASLRGPGGRLLIVQEGDIVEGMKVTSIGRSAVEFQWRGSAFRVVAGRSAPAG